MEIRFNTINEEVEKVLEEIDKHNRKFFVETALLHYINHLENNSDTIDLFYSSRKKAEPKPKADKIKPKIKSKEPKVKEEVKIEEKPKATDNSSLGALGW